MVWLDGCLPMLLSCLCVLCEGLETATAVCLLMAYETRLINKEMAHSNPVRTRHSRPQLRCSNYHSVSPFLSKLCQAISASWWLAGCSPTDRPLHRICTSQCCHQRQRPVNVSTELAIQGMAIAVYTHSSIETLAGCRVWCQPQLWCHDGG